MNKYIWMEIVKSSRHEEHDSHLEIWYSAFSGSISPMFVMFGKQVINYAKKLADDGSWPRSIFDV